ncbi:MAG: hypothetical protein CMQ20_17995 [Gammaproteobacteria bacterium]|nr:hypothetical protein [Gammaproteobacteria bacterium]
MAMDNEFRSSLLLSGSKLVEIRECIDRRFPCEDVSRLPAESEPASANMIIGELLSLADIWKGKMAG